MQYFWPKGSWHHRLSLAVFVVMHLSTLAEAASGAPSPVLYTALESRFEFVLTREGQLRTEESKFARFRSTGSEVAHAVTTYYNDQVKLTKTRFEKADGSRFRPLQGCAHVQSGEFFYSDFQECIYSLMVSQPVTYKIEREYLDPKYLSRVFFHESSDVTHRSIVFNIPDYVDVEFVEFNFDGFEINRSEITENGHRKIIYDSYDLDGTANSDMSTASRCLPHIIPVVHSFVDKNRIKHEVLADVQGLYEWYRQLTSDTSLEEGLKELVDGFGKDAESPEDLIRSIYYWVQDNIRYIAFEDGIAGFKPEDPNVTYFNKYGDCKAMANLLEHMLDYAGFDARLSWMGTSRLPYTYDIPSLVVDNHMICAVIQSRDTVFLDATNDFVSLREMPYHLMNKEVLVEGNDDYFITKIPARDAQKNEVYHHLEISFNDEVTELKGKGTLQLSGVYKIIMKEILDFTGDEEYEALLAYLLKGEIDDLRIDSIGPLDREKDLMITYSFQDRSLLSTFGEEVYLTLPEVQTFFNLEEIADGDWMLHDVGIPSTQQYSISITNPEVAELVTVPNDFDLVTNHYDLKREVKNEGSALLLQYQYQLSNHLIPDAMKVQWNEHVRAVSKSQREPFIFTLR